MIEVVDISPFNDCNYEDKIRLHMLEKLLNHLEEEGMWDECVRIAQRLGVDILRDRDEFESARYKLYEYDLPFGY